MNNSHDKDSSIPYNMKEEIFKPPYGFYAAGFISLIYGFIFPLYRWYDFIIVIILSIATFTLTNKLVPSKKILVPIKEKPILSGNADVDSIINNGISYLKEIREANDKISDSKLSAEIFRMEKATDKIFRYIAKHPKESPQIRKFMNYYLPTSLKLLNSYISLKEQSIAGDNIHKTVSNIEGILSTIADAFEKQLDNLFADQALDISTDITVLEGMLAQEGLTNKNDFK
ncbi:MAG: 5-bromo-4-chloroindolyl phosphate hydrolysis family protein [Clostridium sp.]